MLFIYHIHFFFSLYFLFYNQDMIKIERTDQQWFLLLSIGTRRQTKHSRTFKTKLQVPRRKNMWFKLCIPKIKFVTHINLMLEFFTILILYRLIPLMFDNVKEDFIVTHDALEYWFNPSKKNHIHMEHMMRNCWRILQFEK